MKFILIFVLTFFFVSCNSSKNTSNELYESSDEVSTIDGNWLLLSWKTKENLPFFDLNKTPSIQVSKDKITGFGGCNRFNASISIDKSILQISKIAATRMFCEGVAENDFFSILREVNRFEIKENELFLFDSQNQSLVFKLIK
jgi:heat shock protein HslJ